MFKIIAIKPLKGCSSAVLKCLKEEQTYYFCNDYTITEDGIGLRDEYVRPLPNDFFSTSTNPQLRINISAVVGMNGDGKSTLIELIMRLINNCAKSYKIADKENLLRVEGVKAELYYEIDKVIYCIREREEDTRTSLLKYAILSDNNIRQWEKILTPVKSVYKLNELFYTIVSNYSHYAYNTNDFRDEWANNLMGKGEGEKCWLYYLFHKNDGYLAPITIHPFRDKGNVDINRETELTMQRLMALYIQEPSPKENEHSFRRIGEKDAEILQLTDVGESKLQETTLIQFFKENKSVSSLAGTIGQIEENLKDYNDILVEDLLENKLEIIETSLDFLTGLNDKNYQNYLNNCLEWISKRRGVYSSRSDIRLLLSALLKFKNNFDDLPFDRFAKKYKKYDKLNVRQLTRLRYIYRVMQLWGVNTALLLKEYAKLSDIERCQHYIVYKTINICATYPDYRDAMDEADRGWNNVGLVFRDDIINDMVARIKEDKTHVTLKLRQCLAFIEQRERDNEKNVFESLDFVPESPRAKEFHEGHLWVKFDDLKKYYKIDPFPLYLLPPPIYKTEILYYSVKRQEELIPYRYLSSGEKQLLNNFGALIYHLRNLDSVSTTRKHYENVNIFLEEIELYFHPEYQRRIVKLLLDKVSALAFNNIKRINITFITHSPFILSDIPLCNVLFLKEGRPDANSMQENTFGANIHGLLRNGFFLPSLPIGEFAHEKIDMLFNRLNGYKLNSTDKDQAEWFYSNIMRVGEPYLREQLMKLYNMHYSSIKQ